MQICFKYICYILLIYIADILFCLAFLCAIAVCTYIVTLWNSMVKQNFKFFLCQLPAGRNSFFLLFLNGIVHVFEDATTVVYGSNLFLNHDFHSFQHGIKTIFRKIGGEFLPVFWGDWFAKVIFVGIAESLELPIFFSTVFKLPTP